MGKLALSSKGTLKKLLHAWRQKFFDVTFEFTASSTRERAQVIDRVRRLAKAYRLRSIGCAELCVEKSPVVQMMTFHCGKTPRSIMSQIMEGVTKIAKDHPAVEWHFRFVTKI